MTVHQLIAALQALPDDQKDLLVLAEGCDCYGEAQSVVVSPNGIGWGEAYVLVSRQDAGERP